MTDLLSPKALPDRGWRFLQRGGVAIEHYSGRATASGYLFQVRKLAAPRLGFVEPCRIVRSATIEVSGTVDAAIMEAARAAGKYVTATRGDHEPIVLRGFRLDPCNPGGKASEYGLRALVTLDLYIGGERVPDVALSLLSARVPLRRTDWDGAMPPNTDGIYTPRIG